MAFAAECVIISIVSSSHRLSLGMLGIAGFKFVGAMIIKQRYAQQTCGFS
jgi:hypothetical protein